LTSRVRQPLHYTRLHIIPSFPFVLLLASGSRPSFLVFLCNMATDCTVNSALPVSHASAFFWLLVIPNTKHQYAHIHHQPAHIYTHYFHVYISTFPCFSHHLKFFSKGKGWCTLPVSTGLRYCRLSGLNISSFHFGVCFPDPCPFSALYLSFCLSPRACLVALAPISPFVTFPV